MFRGFATFLKKGSAKNFPEGNFLNNIVRSSKEIGRYVHHANSDSVKFLVKFFSKNLQGLGQSPMENSVFFLLSFFFCASGVKRKSGSVRFYVFMVKAPIKAFSSGRRCRGTRRMRCLLVKKQLYFLYAKELLIHRYRGPPSPTGEGFQERTHIAHPKKSGLDFYVVKSEIACRHLLFTFFKKNASCV